jgi:hypothetical protein
MNCVRRRLLSFINNVSNMRPEGAMEISLQVQLSRHCGSAINLVVNPDQYKPSRKGKKIEFACLQELKVLIDRLGSSSGAWEIVHGFLNNFYSNFHRKYFLTYILLMKSSREVRASDCQCQTSTQCNLRGGR